MAIQIVTKAEQARGAFNGGEIIENKPIGFNREGGKLKPFSNLFYWAYAEAKTDSTIGLHPHQGFEIMSFVLNGEIRHFDNKGNKWIPLQEGDVQIIRSGSGISHAEFMAKDAVMFQIWFDPGLESSMAKPASYDDHIKESFPEIAGDNYQIRTLVGPGSDLQMESLGVQIQRIFADAGAHQFDLDPTFVHSFYLIKGDLTLDGNTVHAHDFIKIDGEGQLKFSADESVDIFHIATPANLPYATYTQLMQAQFGA